MASKLKVWIEDYLQAAKFYGLSFLYRQPPTHYLDRVVANKPPIVLLPGVNTKWPFLKLIADELSLEGYPVYVLNKLKYNRKSITESATILRALVEEEDLHEVILLAHSKGGLIGKEALLHCNEDERISWVIAIATPFAGSKIGAFSIDQAVRELSPASVVVRKQQQDSKVNKKIISIYGTFDNHVWPTESCQLEGAENIQIEVDGHHKILWHPSVRKIVHQKITLIANAKN